MTPVQLPEVPALAVRVARYIGMATLSVALFLLAIFFAVYLRDPIGMIAGLVASVASWPTWETNSDR